MPEREMSEIKGWDDMEKNEKEPPRDTKRSTQLLAWKSLAFALGVGVSACAPESKSQEQQAHHHTMAHEALSEMFSKSFRAIRMVDEDKNFFYFQVAPLRFVKVKNSQAHISYINQLFSSWKHNSERAKTQAEKDRANEFHKEKIGYELSRMGTLVE